MSVRVGPLSGITRESGALALGAASGTFESFRSPYLTEAQVDAPTAFVKPQE